MTMTAPTALGRPTLLGYLANRLAETRARFVAMLPPRSEGITLLIVLALLGLWLAAALVFGYPAIILPALALVPTILVLLLTITWG